MTNYKKVYKLSNQAIPNSLLIFRGKNQYEGAELWVHFYE
jgi:hypothetical protein